MRSPSQNGEGKTLINTLLAFILLMQGLRVHIISSSENLSIRDQEIAEKLFSKFQIQTAHICEQHPKEEKFLKRVIYGRVHDFQFSIMKEMMLGSSIFPESNTFQLEKRFDVVLIDEMDNLMLDRVFTHARLSYPAGITYEWIYLPIFTFVKNNIAKNESLKLTSKEVLNEMKSFVKSKIEKKYHLQLEAISNEKFQEWLRLAYQALHNYENKKKYALIKTADGKPAIVIVDAENTGRFLHGSRWSNGLHEFVEVKHDILPEKESVTPLSISHAVFYQFYHRIYGLTGTLGSRTERDEIKEIYGVESFDVPTHLPCQRVDKPILIVDTFKEYWKTSLDKICECRKEQRPFLGICDTIEQSDEVADLLKKNNLPFKLLNEMQLESEAEILKSAGEPGAITIATNTGGRGIDIILNEVSRKNGGLYVLFFFFPESERSEFQGRGRAGRQGEKGTSEIIISREHIKEMPGVAKASPQEIEKYLNKKRDLSVKEAKEQHLTQASLDRSRFNYILLFFNQLDKFRRLLDNEYFLNQIATSLSHLKLVKEKKEKKWLADPSEVQLRDILFDLLSSGGTPINYKLLLQKTGKKIVDKCLNIWAIHFNQKVDDLFKESEIQVASFQKKHFLKTLLDFFESEKTFSKDHTVKMENFLKHEIEKYQKENLVGLQKEITLTFEKTKAFWEPYLDLSGNGLISYLEEISELTLSGQSIPSSSILSGSRMSTL